jgi:hypothetical protein
MGFLISEVSRMGVNPEPTPLRRRLEDKRNRKGVLYQYSGTLYALFFLTKSSLLTRDGVQGYKIIL